MYIRLNQPVGRTDRERAIEPATEQTYVHRVLRFCDLQPHKTNGQCALQCVSHALCCAAMRCRAHRETENRMCYLRFFLSLLFFLRRTFVVNADDDWSHAEQLPLIFGGSCRRFMLMWSVVVDGHSASHSWQAADRKRRLKDSVIVLNALVQRMLIAGVAGSQTSSIKDRTRTNLSSVYTNMCNRKTQTGTKAPSVSVCFSRS